MGDADPVGGGWTIEWEHGTPAELHGRPVPARRVASVYQVDRPAVVLGSAQPETTVDREAARAAGVDVVRRRGGGGAVWLSPFAQSWIDIVVPVGDPLWRDDVGQAFVWVGELYVEALAALGLDAVVHRHGLVRTDASGLICFAGLGPGEVHVGGSKLVGMSQRRTREAARFQCVVYERFDPAPMLELLRLDGFDAAVLGAELAATSVGLADVVAPGRIPALEKAVVALLDGGRFLDAQPG